MRQEPADISLDSLLRALERHYALHAAPIFRANGIPEPPRLPVPAAPDPANEVVQGFRSLERSGRHGARNAVRAPEGANPEKYLPVPASWLPSRIIWPLEITLSRLAQGRESLKCSCQNMGTTWHSFCDSAPVILRDTILIVP